MTHHEGTPPNQNNGPIKDSVPHSGQLPPHMRELPGREFDNTSLDEAHNRHLIDTPSSTKQLGDLTEDELKLIKTHRKNRAKSGERKGLKRMVAGAIGGAVFLGGGYAAVRALGSDNDPSVDPNRPVATGSAVAGKTPGANSTEAPTKAPTSQGTPEDPVSRASREAQQGHEKLVSERKPFYENPVTSVTLNGMMVDDKTRELLVPGLTQGQIVPGSEFFPNSLAAGHVTFERILGLQQELSTAFSDGTLAKAIEQSNQLYHTNYKLEDFYISKNEVPANATGTNKQLASEFLANKVVHITQMFGTLAAATRHGEPMAAVETGEPRPSDKFTAMSHLLDSDQAAAKATKDKMGRFDGADYTPDSVVPTSARLVTNAGGTENYNGSRIEVGKDGLADVFTPVIGVVADTQEAFVGDDGYVSFPQQQNLNYYMLVPVEVSGQVVDVPVSMGGKRLKLLG